MVETKETPEWLKFWKGLFYGVLMDGLIIFLLFLFIIILFAFPVKAESIYYNYFKVVDQDTKQPINNSLVTNLITEETFTTNETGMVFMVVPSYLVYPYRIELEGYQTVYHDQLSYFWRHPLDNQTYPFEVDHTYISIDDKTLSTPFSDAFVKFLIGFSIAGGVLVVLVLVFLSITYLKR